MKYIPTGNILLIPTGKSLWNEWSLPIIYIMSLYRICSKIRLWEGFKPYQTESSLLFYAFAVLARTGITFLI